jgi:hypothetical protein
MAQPLLDFLVGRAKAALPFLRKAAKEGLTATAAIESLKALNLTFQRQRMLDVYAALQSRADVNQYIRLVGENTVLPEEAHHPAETNLNSNYQYVVGGVNAAGEDLGFATITSAVPLAAIEIRALGTGLLASGSYLEDVVTDLEVAYVTIEEANVSPTAVRP